MKNKTRDWNADILETARRLVGHWRLHKRDGPRGCHQGEIKNHLEILDSLFSHKDNAKGA